MQDDTIGQLESQIRYACQKSPTKEKRALQKSHVKLKRDPLTHSHLANQPGFQG